MLDDDAQVLGARPVGDGAQHLLGAAADDRQRAADLVGDTGRQHADRDQLLGANQLVFQIAQLRLIFDQREGTHAQLMVAHRHDADVVLLRPCREGAQRP